MCLFTPVELKLRMQQRSRTKKSQFFILKTLPRIIIYFKDKNYPGLLFILKIKTYVFIYTSRTKTKDVAAKQNKKSHNFFILKTLPRICCAASGCCMAKTRIPAVLKNKNENCKNNSNGTGRNKHVPASIARARLN